MFKYETHLHTAPVSKCARKGIRENLEFYKKLGYDGVFITNHFLDGNINIDRDRPYSEKIDFYFSDFETASEMSSEIGIKVFLGIEMSYFGTDFLVYGLDKEWFLQNPQIMNMQKSEELPFLAENGAFIIQAHPYREAAYIDHIRLFPRCVHGAETINACRTDFENKMADMYADAYELLKTAGSDNHLADEIPVLAGMMSNTPLSAAADYIDAVKAGKMQIFREENPYFRSDVK